MKTLPRYAVLAAMLFGLPGCYTAPTPTPIVIGHVSDKTRFDKAGEQAERGIRLALHELNKDDALTTALGGRAVQVRHTDAHGSIDAFEAEGVRLVNVNRALALLGGLTAKETAALDQAQVPVLSFAGYRAPGASNQVFYLGMTPAKQGEILAQFVAENPKVQRFVLLADERRPESTIVAEAFEKTLADARKSSNLKPPAVITLRFGKDAGISPPREENQGASKPGKSEPVAAEPPAALRWADTMERTRAHDPQAILFAGAVQDFNGWQRAYRQEVFLTEPMLIHAGDDGAANSFDLDPKLSTPIVVATAFLADGASEKTVAFRKAFQEAFKTEPDVHAALAYDGFRILAEALRSAYPILTIERLRDDLAKKTKDFAGVTGPLTVTPERQLQRPLFVARWHNGTLTHLKTFP